METQMSYIVTSERTSRLPACSQVFDRHSWLKSYFWIGNWSWYWSHIATHLNCSSSFACFYRAMLRRARLCHSKSSVRLSVCPSVCLWRWDIIFTQVGILRK